VSETTNESPAVSTQAEMIARLSGLLDRLDDGSEYEACGNHKGHVCEHDNPKDLFRALYVEHDYAEGDRKVGTIECGSVRALDPVTQEKDTARWFYRLLSLVEPKTKFDFSDMYKTGGLLTLRSPDWRFVAVALLFKYELGIYFSASPECIDGKSNCVVAGHPGANNGVAMKDPVLKAWVALLIRCLSRKWLVYSGNNFEV